MPKSTNMTPERENELFDLKLEFLSRVDAKYRKGAAHHGADPKESFDDKDAFFFVQQAMDECIDQWTYLYKLKERLRDEESERRRRTAKVGEGEPRP